MSRIGLKEIAFEGMKSIERNLSLLKFLVRASQKNIQYDKHKSELYSSYTKCFDVVKNMRLK